MQPPHRGEESHTCKTDHWTFLAYRRAPDNAHRRPVADRAAHISADADAHRVASHFHATADPYAYFPYCYRRGYED